MVQVWLLLVGALLYIVSYPVSSERNRQIQSFYKRFFTATRAIATLDSTHITSNLTKSLVGRVSTREIAIFLVLLS
jgi:hypothetical protein